MGRSSRRRHPLIVAPNRHRYSLSVAGSDLDEGQVAKDLTTMRMAMAVNALGLPAVAVPSAIQDLVDRRP